MLHSLLSQACTYEPACPVLSCPVLPCRVLPCPDQVLPPPPRRFSPALLLTFKTFTHSLLAGERNTSGVCVCVWGGGGEGDTRTAHDEPSPPPHPANTQTLTPRAVSPTYCGLGWGRGWGWGRGGGCVLGWDEVVCGVDIPFPSSIPGGLLLLLSR